MPHVINGIGTWYLGKRNSVTRRANCGACGQIANLASYDTTLYFVIFFIPVLPLGSKKILDECPVCKRHRVTSLTQYNTGRQQAAEASLREVQADPTSAVKGVDAIRTACMFNDEQSFLALTALIEPTNPTSPDLIETLGEGYDWFNHAGAATECFERVVAVAPTLERKRRLAAHLLKHRTYGGLAKALPLLSDDLKTPSKEAVGLYVLLCEAQRAEGKHEDALRTLDLVAAADPKLVKDAWYKQTRKTSERERASGKPIASPLLEVSEQSVIPLLIAIFLAVAAWKGTHQQVWVVNGLDVPYNVQVGKATVSLLPQSAQQVEIGQGNVVIRSLSPDVPIPEDTVRVQTSFWTRPFSRDVIVINPDRLAIVFEDESYYAANNPPPNSEPKGVAGEPLYTFSKIDHQFEQFPTSIKTQSGGGIITRRRVDMARAFTMADRVAWYEFVGGAPLRKRLIPHLVTLQPHDRAAHTAMMEHVPESESLAVVSPMLAQRPAILEAHRTYQVLTERLRPDHDLVGEYRGYLAQRPDDAVLKYLLGRITEDVAESRRLLNEATQAMPPVSAAFGALAYQAASEADFGGTLANTTKAIETEDSESFQHMRVSAQVALRKFDDALNGPWLVPSESMHVVQVITRVQVLAMADRFDEAQAFIDTAAPPDGELHEYREYLLSYVAYIRGDMAAFVSHANASGNVNLRFQAAIAESRLEDAEAILAEVDGDQTYGALTLLVAAQRAANTTISARQLEMALVALAKSGAGERQAARWLRAAATGTGARATAAQLRLHPMHYALKTLVLAAMIEYGDPAAIECLDLLEAFMFDVQPPNRLVMKTIERAKQK
jgi:hypothetical protein